MSHRERGGLSDAKTIARFPIIARSIRQYHPLLTDAPFRLSSRFFGFFGREKYRIRYRIRRELRLVNRLLLFNHLYRVNNRAHVYSPLYPLFFCLPFSSLLLLTDTAGNR